MRFSFGHALTTKDMNVTGMNQERWWCVVVVVVVVVLLVVVLVVVGGAGRRNQDGPSIQVSDFSLGYSTDGFLETNLEFHGQIVSTAGKDGVVLLGQDKHQITGCGTRNGIHFPTQHHRFTRGHAPWHIHLDPFGTLLARLFHQNRPFHTTVQILQRYLKLIPNRTVSWCTIRLV